MRFSRSARAKRVGTCLKGMKLVAGGNAPGKRRFQSRPWKVAVSTDDIMQVESLFGSVRPFQGREALQFSGGVAPGY